MGKKNKKKKSTKLSIDDFIIERTQLWSGHMSPDIEHNVDEDGFLHLTPKQELNVNPWKPKLSKKERQERILPDLYHSILYSRFDGRPIPKADDGIKDPDKNISLDQLRDYYARCHVGEYVRLDSQTRGKGDTVTSNRLKFEFESMMNLDSLKVNTDDKDENDLIRRLSYAEMNKKSFINKINNTLRYVNYFIEYFDDDDELMYIYFELMYQIMDRNINLDPESFMEHLYAYFTTDSMREKIIRMVEYNTDDTLVKSDQSYDESIQLTIEHLKAIMAVSCIHKFIIPIVGHYYNMKSRLLEKMGLNEKDLYYYIFASFIPVFDDYYDISLYDKLYHTATTRVKKTYNQESTMWRRRHRFGTTPTSFTHKLMRDFLIDISQKAVFSKSAIIFIHVCFDNSIVNELKQPDKYEFTDMKMEASDSVNETISRFDRWMMDHTFHSQLDRVRAFVSIKDSIYYLGELVGIDFKRMDSKDPNDIKKTKDLHDEYDYYLEHIQMPLNDSQLYIVYLYYSSMIGCTEEAKMLEVSDIIKLIMIMKRDFESRNYDYLRFFISGKLQVGSAHPYNKRKLERLFQNDPCYEDWIKQYPDLKAFNLDRFYKEVTPIISCPITIVDHSYPEYDGKTYTPEDVLVCSELIRFLNSL